MKASALATRVPSVLRTLHPGRLRYFTRKLRHPISPHDYVVDVGSGGDPHPRADVVVDNSIVANYHRTVNFRRADNLVVADIMALPFRDGAFDYSICSHVLEHLDDPAGGASELTRVSRAGYVETPSDIHEKLFPMAWHKWMVRKIGDRLCFEAKQSAKPDQRLGDWFANRWEKDRSLMNFVWSHTDDLFVQLHWRGRIEVEVVGTPAQWFNPEEALVELQSADAPDSSDSKRSLYDLAARVRYRRPSR